MRKRIDLEYIFSSSVTILFSRLSSAPGLAEWFSDDVKWLDADDEEEFFEFSLHVEPLTEEVALIITDFVDADEEGDAIELWNKQVEMLHRTVGG